MSLRWTHVNDTKYSPLPIQKGHNPLCTFVYCEDMADCSRNVYNYVVSCKRPKLAVPLLVVMLSNNMFLVYIHRQH